MDQFRVTIPDEYRESFFRILGSTPDGALMALTMARSNEDVANTFIGLQRSTKDPEPVIPYEMCRLTSDGDTLEDGYCMPMEDIFSPRTKPDDSLLGSVQVPIKEIPQLLFKTIIEMARAADQRQLPNDAREAIDMMVIRDVHNE